MRFLRTYILFVFVTSLGFSQSTFHIENNKNKVVIPFQLINNLIFIPVNVNGEQLTFLLDTGVEETILFSLDDKSEVSFFNVKKIKLRGLGSANAIEALKSSRNKLEIKGLVDDNHEIFIILDQEFNFSSQVGIPVNGILGYHFFKNHLVEMDYDRKKIIVYENDKKIKKRIDKKFTSEAISIENNKPYFISDVTSDEAVFPSKVLLDTGNSDALWVFSDKKTTVPLPKVTVNDYLGRGFSGDIYGLRGRVSSMKFGNIKFEKPIATFPDSTSIREVILVKDRVGSIGGEIFKRFTIIFDYPNSKIYTRKNSNYQEPFSYNMSGIDIQHEGLEWVKDSYSENPTLSENIFDGNGNKVDNNLKFKFELKPIFKISNVRAGSTAAEAGLLKGDKIIKINNRLAYGYTMEKINEILKSEEGKEIEMEVERNGKIIKVKFLLKTIL